MVSIIVPVYNIKNYLPHCVDSLLGQTCTELEILLVDDGSTDGSGDLCDRLGEKDQRIRVIHKENGGLSDARNAGLDAATGQWILFVDGDDYLAEDAVERLLDAAREDADFVQFFYHETEDLAWRPDNSQPAAPEIETQPAQMWRRIYRLGGVAASSCTKLWNRRVFEDIRFQKGILHEDEELLNRVLPKCRKAIYTDLTLYAYVMRSGSIIRSAFRKKSMDVFPLLEDRIPVLEALGCDDLVQETKCRLFRTAAWQYCLARKGGFRTEAAQLKKKLLELAKQPDLPLAGQYKLLYRASKLTSGAPAIYYFLRRMTGKS